MAIQTFFYETTSLRSTEDGFTFAIKTMPASFGANPLLEVHNGKLFMIGHVGSIALNNRKCFSSDDGGTTWTEVSTMPAEYESRTGSTSRLISFSGSLWIIGNLTNGNANYNVLKSTDEGVTWSVVPTNLISATGINSILPLGTTYYLPKTNTLGLKTTDFTNYLDVNFTNMPVGANIHSTGSAFYFMKHDGNGQQIYESTNGNSFNKITNFVYGDPEYEIEESLPPSIGFMDTGTVYVTDANNRIYFLHSVNKSVMSAPVTNPTTLRSESNTNIVAGITYKEVVGNINVAISPISVSASVDGTISFTAVPTIVEATLPLLVNADFSGIVNLSGLASIVLAQVQPPIDVSALFVGIASMTAIGEIFTAPNRGGTIRLNGMPIQSVNVYVIRVSDNALYALTTDSNGTYIIPEEAGECHVMCVYKDAESNLYSAMVHPFVAVT